MTLKSSLSLQELDFISMHIKYSWQNLWLNERPCWPVMQAWFALWSRQRQVPLAAGQLVVATLRRRCEHHIFALWFLLCTFFFSRLFSAVTDWMSTYFHTWCGHNANLGCMSETCYMRLSETGCKKSPKICHLRTIVQLRRAISWQLRHISTIGKKVVKQQYLLQMSPQYGELRPSSGWDRSGSLGHPS